MKRILLPAFFVFSFQICTAQIEVAHLSMKDFKAFGFGTFLNFSFPVSDANYLTLEGGLQYFKKKGDEVGVFPVLVGYRYTLNGSGTGLYAETFAGYNFGGTTIQVRDSLGLLVYDADGEVYQKIAGPAAGIGLGYLFEPAGIVQFNVSLRYEHGFGNAQANILSFRISHAFTFGRRNQ